MFKKFHRALFVQLLVAALIFFAGCPQANQQYAFEVKIADGEKVVFSHPKFSEEINKGNFCVLQRISVVKKGENNFSDTVWQLDGQNGGGFAPEQALRNPFIAYGEPVAGMSIWREPKILRDGRYSVSGYVGVYNGKKEFLYDMPLSSEFNLTTDAAGRLAIADSKQKS